MSLRDHLASVLAALAILVTIIAVLLAVAGYAYHSIASWTLAAVLVLASGTAQGWRNLLGL